MKALEGADRASLLRHRKHALTTDGVQLNTQGHNIVSEVLLRGLMGGSGARPTKAIGAAGAVGSGPAETDSATLPLPPPPFKERRAVPHLRAPGETTPLPRLSAAADEYESEPEPTSGEQQQQQEHKHEQQEVGHEGEHDSFLSEEDMALFDEL
jgi:hypothetical protein